MSGITASGKEDREMRETKVIADKSFHDPEYARIVGNVKRILEKWTLDADFNAAYKQDPDKALAETGLDVDPESIRLLLDAETRKEIRSAVEEGSLDQKDLPEGFRLYEAFIREKLESREKMRVELCAPDEPRFKDWRERQSRRCWLELGSVAARSMVQAPLMFELSEGCSVGCPFCGVAAKGLVGVFRYTEEHAALWRDILNRLHTLIGDAAGSGTCYYSCEGLDNPDYEKFLADFFAEFGVVPQTTTAVSTRNIERTRALLQYGLENDPHIDRFSVLSPVMRDTLFEAFTPEELILVELLPQFPEAPDCRLTEVGRNRSEDKEDAIGGTIACASGFVVNMQEKSVRLITPFISDKKHPTGEWILEKCSFSTAEDLENTVRRMIAEYMPERMDLNGLFQASCDFSLEEKDDQVWAKGHSLGVSLMDAAIGQETLDQMLALIKKGAHTGYDILDALPEDADLSYIILLMKLLWKYGLIDQTHANHI